MATEKTADVREDQDTPLLDLKNICFMVGIIVCLFLFLVEVIASIL